MLTSSATQDQHDLTRSVSQLMGASRELAMFAYNVYSQT
jgi:hypothetical protein